MSAETVRVDSILPTSCLICGAVSICDGKILQNSIKFRKVIIHKLTSDTVKTISRKNPIHPELIAFAI